MNNGFASHCLVLTMLAGMLPAHSIAARTDRTQGVNEAAPTSHVAQSSAPCAQAPLGGCKEELQKVRRAYERLQRTYVDRFDDLEEAVRTLRSGEPGRASELIASTPDWLYCIPHPFWCKRGL